MVSLHWEVARQLPKGVSAEVLARSPRFANHFHATGKNIAIFKEFSLDHICFVDLEKICDYIPSWRPDVVESIPDDPTYNVSSELTLEVSASDDNTIIACVVDHDSVKPGEKKSEQSLRVLYAPEVAINPDERMAIEGQRFSLQCSGKGNPEPTIYSWEKADGELPPLVKADGAILSFLMLNKSDNGVYTCHADNGIGKGRGSYMLQVQDTTAMSTSSGVDHAVIGGVVAVIVFILLCLLIVLGRYLIRHKGTYLTHEAKGSDDAPDADTAIINAEGGHSGAEEKKEYFI
ncbi:hypothetical protein CRENBAI_007081 [Crenichthys baileyi]|uniref:Ig-like domain-containing protein n=1 Tax=Crenichthys baileyi TaxID=28760 RepID=A0AAV9QVK0_9TELE